MMEPKAAFREAVKERIARLNARKRAAESRTIVRELKKYIGNEPRGIALYMPLSDEPDIAPLMKELSDAGWTIILPRKEEKTFSMRRARDLTKLVKGPIGPLEPTSDDPVAEPADIDIAVVPGRAFARDGRRMGRGNGGYDFWIRAQRKANPQTAFIGICFESQIFNDVPMEPHDERVDVVITSRGVTGIA